MEIEGTIIFDLPLQEGISKSSGRPWKKKEWVLETAGMYPRRVKFHVFGDRVDMLRFEVGKSYACTFELESREFNGRWYTDVNVMSARQIENPMSGMGGPQPPLGGIQQPTGGFGTQTTQGGPVPPAQPVNPAADPFAGGDNSTDDLPF